MVNLSRRAEVDSASKPHLVTSIGVRGGRSKLQIFARHEVTGMGKMFEQRYHHPGSEIVTGSFVHGHDMSVTREAAQTRRRSEAQRESS
ncbi:hypothetical protein Q5425_16460 [Amycolatopsis sp. A133]|uniref:hypothetical protein n=1 Tax=Amycolatopsis sp. A133 TaxID=3064472 RepID=UPI0027F75CBE|nr:hypothetical protein [Amycolatopsis sp. A133]MDQ7805341.1 hypothetical protein [Amycolatopsis sp. A133]